MLQATPGLHVLNRDATNFLRSPIGNIEHLDSHLVKSGSTFLSHGLLHSNDTLFLLHHFSIPKILYILKTAQCFFHLTLMLMTGCSDHSLVISSM